MEQSEYGATPIDIAAYGGKQVAILDGAIIASGNTLAAVLAEVRRRVLDRPLGDVKIFAVPTSTAVVYVARVPVRHRTP